jgi:hypothetical protein
MQPGAQVSALTKQVVSWSAARRPPKCWLTIAGVSLNLARLECPGTSGCSLQQSGAPTPLPLVIRTDRERREIAVSVKVQRADNLAPFNVDPLGLPPDAAGGFSDHHVVDVRGAQE